MMKRMADGVPTSAKWKPPPPDAHADVIRTMSDECRIMNDLTRQLLNLTVDVNLWFDNHSRFFERAEMEDPDDEWL